MGSKPASNTRSRRRPSCPGRQRRPRPSTGETLRLLRQLQMLAAELARTEERERDRLAQLLHDHLQQLLVAARLRLSLLDRRTPQQAWGKIIAETDDLIDHAIESARSLTVELSPPVLREHGFVAALRWLSSWMHEKHALKIEIEAEPNAEPWDHATSVLCFQAVRELLLNVAKHARTPCARVSLKTAGDKLVKIVVSDRGIGFQPVAGTSSRPVESFGLQNVERRLRMIGGRLSIRSKPNRGTSVTLLVRDRLGEPSSAVHSLAPSTKPTPLQTVDPKRNQPLRLRRRRPVKLVLADDHRTLREALVGVLRLQTDMEVVGQAEDGHTAVRMVRLLRPDIVIMDVGMPGLDGIAATRQIASESPGVKVIGLSMHEHGDKANAMREAGAADYLTKSGPVQELVEAIRRCARTGRATRRISR